MQKFNQYEVNIKQQLESWPQFILRGWYRVL